MIRNLYLRVQRFFYTVVYNIFSLLNYFWKHQKNKILVYDPDYDKFDNTGALFDYLIEKEYFKKYKIVHVCKNYKELRKEKYPNVWFDNKISGLYHYLNSTYVYYRGSTLRIIPAKGQHVIQMWHGSPCKGGGRAPQDNWINPYYTGFFSASKHFNAIFSKVFSVPEDRMILCGHPRTDDLFKSFPKYDFGHYKKLVIWTPTFRKFNVLKYGWGKQLNHDDNLLPIFSLEEFERVNEHLKRIGVKVVVKLHPHQNLEHYNLVDLDHFIILSDEDFKKRGILLYRFLTQCDAMITDYSSIYWDYLVLDRPIAFTEDDVEDYAQGRGFVMDDPEKYKPGPRLITKKDFYQFVDDLANGVDNYRQQRKAMNEYGNPVTDGHSCKRALECVGISM